MEKDNFLNRIATVAGIGAEQLRAELDGVHAPDGFGVAVITKATLGSVGQAGPSGMAASDGTAAALSIAPEEFTQGVFLKIALKSLPPAKAPESFASDVLAKVGAVKPVVSARRTIAAAVTIAAVITGGIIVALQSGGQKEATVKTGTDTVIALPEINPPTVVPAVEKLPANPKDTQKAIRSNTTPAAERTPPTKGDPDAGHPDSGETPED